MTSQEQAASHRLTLEEYKQSRIDRSSGLASPYVAGSFACYYESEFLLENFLKLSAVFQDVTDLFMAKIFQSKCNNDLPDVETWVDLALRIQKARPEIVEQSLSVIDFRKMLNRVIDESFGDDAVLLRSLIKDVEHQYQFENQARFERDGIPLVLVYVLSTHALLESKETVIEVLLRWTDSMHSPGPLSDLIAISRDWDSVKDMPIGWAVNCVRIEALE